MLLDSIYRGHRLFDSLDSAIESEVIDDNNGNIPDPLLGKIFYFKQKDCSGKLKKVKEGWLLLKGSQARNRSFGNSIKDERTIKGIKNAVNLLEGKLDENLQTTEDILFSSPSSPIQSLSQRTANGWKTWKDDQGNFLDFYRNYSSQEK